MDKIIQSMPNDTIAIICNLKEIDKAHDNYAIVPIGVSFGKFDESEYFICEGTDEKIIKVERYEETIDDPEAKYYFYPISIDELKKKFSDKVNSSELAIAYYKEVRDKINLIYKTNDSEEPIVDSFNKRSNEDLKQLNERIEKEYHEKKVNINTISSDDSIDLELASIKRKSLADYLKERIFDNDSIIDDISTVIISNFRTNNPALISNVLCVGPTGSGKTQTFNLIAKYANIPIATIDCNRLTAEGFVGSGTDDIFKEIYSTCGGNIKKANRSIVFFDEVDKIADRGDPIKDIDVQQSLLKILEGAEFSFEHKRGSGLIRINTSLMTKVCSGAFMDLFDKRMQKHKPGFNSVDEPIEEKVLTDKDIINYGFKPEFVGRLPLIYTYKPLSKEGLTRFLVESKISPFLLMSNKFKEEFGVEFEYGDDLLYEIVEEALQTKAGGRSLKKIIDNAFIKLEAALIDEQDEGRQLPKVLKLKKEMITDPTNFNL